MGNNGFGRWSMNTAKAKAQFRMMNGAKGMNVIIQLMGVLGRESTLDLRVSLENAIIKGLKT
jgi:hypothetical protein